MVPKIHNLGNSLAGKIIVEVVKKDKYKLDFILEMINDNNIHNEIKTVTIVGNEKW